MYLINVKSLRKVRKKMVLVLSLHFGMVTYKIKTLLKNRQSNNTHIYIPIKLGRFVLSTILKTNYWLIDI